MGEFGSLFNGINPFTVILAGWPVAFLWLLRYTIIQGYKREKELIEVNKGWQKSFDKLSDAIDKMTNVFILGFHKGGNNNAEGSTGRTSSFKGDTGDSGGPGVG